MHLSHLLLTASCVLLVACGGERGTVTENAATPAAPVPVVAKPEVVYLQIGGTATIERRSDDDVRPVFAGAVYDEPHLIRVEPLFYGYEPRDGRAVQTLDSPIDSVRYWLTTYHLPDGGKRYGLVSGDGKWTSGPRWRSLGHERVTYTFDNRERTEYVLFVEGDAGWEIHPSNHGLPLAEPLVEPKTDREVAKGYLPYAMKIEAKRNYDFLRENAIAAQEKRFAVADPAYKDFCAALDAGDRATADLRRDDAATGHVDVHARYYLRFGGTPEQLRSQIPKVHTDELRAELAKAAEVEEKRLAEVVVQQRVAEEKEHQATEAKRRQEHVAHLERDVQAAMHDYDQWEKGRTDRSFRLASEGLVRTEGPSLRKAEENELRASVAGGAGMTLMDCYIIRQIGRQRFDEWQALKASPRNSP